MSGPVCGSCGNDGTKAALYVTIDARYDPATKSWILEARDDEGGQELDCLDCDSRTAEPDFPYNISVPHGVAAAPDCGQCEGTGTIEGGLSGDGDSEECPVCDGSGNLPIVEGMTLDDATEVFDVSPSDKACADLLRAAAQYESDGMIEADQLRATVERVAEWLADA